MRDLAKSMWEEMLVSKICQMTKFQMHALSESSSLETRKLTVKTFTLIVKMNLALALHKIEVYKGTWCSNLQGISSINQLLSIFDGPK